MNKPRIGKCCRRADLTLHATPRSRRTTGPRDKEPVPKRYAVLVLLLGAIALASQASTAAHPVMIAVADFDYIDSSGEPADQSALHRAQLARFNDGLRAALGGTDRYHVVALSCGKAACSVASADPKDLVAKARAAGAQMLVFGGIQKLSTLVQWVRVEAASTADGRSVYNRLLTFRGDSDAAWQHSQTFAADELLEAAPKP